MTKRLHFSFSVRPRSSCNWVVW